MTVREWLSDWLALRAPMLKVRTIESYRYLIESHIVPEIGEILVEDLTPFAVSHMLAAISSAGHSRTSEMCFVLLRSAFKTLSPNPMLLVVRPAHRQTSPEAWSDADIVRYADAIRGTKHEIPLLLGLLLGLRRGEICGLRWEDVDFQRNMISIRNQRQRLDSGEIVDLSPKSLSSVRDLPIPAALLPLLKQKRNLSGYICSVSPSGLDAAHRRIVSAVGVPYIPLHGLRHSMATACIRHGGSMRSLQSILGHASYSTTANRYTHPDIEMLQKAVDLASGYVV